MFCHRSEVESKLTKDCRGAWLADSLSRPTSNTGESVVNFPAPIDLSRFLELRSPIWRDSLLVYAQVSLNNIKTAREALFREAEAAGRTGPRVLFKEEGEGV